MEKAPIAYGFARGCFFFHKCASGSISATYSVTIAFVLSGRRKRNNKEMLQHALLINALLIFAVNFLQGFTPIR